MSAGLPGPADSLARWVLRDWAANAGYPDSRACLLVFRFSQWATARWGRPGRLVALVCQTLNSLALGVELPAVCPVGPRLRLFHPHTVVVNPGVVIGADCVLRHGTTLGNVVEADGRERGNPVIGDRVELGATCAVLGPVHVGDDARVGALAVVTRDVAPGQVVVGAPARPVARPAAVEEAGRGPGDDDVAPAASLLQVPREV
ncbi:serine acetyltransferase [Nocardioides sp. GY 10127]|uniref:serine O-acetyltransferase n=1 Tax=Nocardioides sp. GY 10127 TaxID=2569762 RepID=UPI001457F621|nr:serine acetyltransferase [Nocardioides sp. GY 10127]